MTDPSGRTFRRIKRIGDVKFGAPVYGNRHRNETWVVEYEGEAQPYGVVDIRGGEVVGHTGPQYDSAEEAESSGVLQGNDSAEHLGGSFDLNYEEKGMNKYQLRTKGGGRGGDYKNKNYHEPYPETDLGRDAREQYVRQQRGWGDNDGFPHNRSRNPDILNELKWVEDPKMDGHLYTKVCFNDRTAEVHDLGASYKKYGFGWYFYRGEELVDTKGGFATAQEAMDDFDQELGKSNSRRDAYALRAAGLINRYGFEKAAQMVGIKKAEGEDSGFVLDACASAEQHTLGRFLNETDENQMMSDMDGNERFFATIYNIINPMGDIMAEKVIEYGYGDGSVYSSIVKNKNMVDVQESSAEATVESYFGDTGDDVRQEQESNYQADVSDSLR